MKIVIDTNILISAMLKDGLPESIILWILNNPESVSYTHLTLPTNREV